MIERSALEHILAANGIAATSPDEQIKSVLVEANWHQDDVDTALTVLRENVETHEQKVDSLHKIFRTDQRLKPETISALLGIDVEVPPSVHSQRPEVKRYNQAAQMMNIGLFSLVCCDRIVREWPT